MSNHKEPDKEPIDLDKLRKKIKSELKKELLAEIYKELKAEEQETIGKTKTKKSDVIDISHDSVKISEPIEPIEQEPIVIVSVKAILKIASHAVKYANKKIPREKWVEVIGLLAGRIDSTDKNLYVEDAYPMGHGTAIHAEIKDYKNYVRAFNEIKKQNYFICGWYHSHPSYGNFMSTEDFDTQARYQKLWKESIALVIDPFQIDGTSFGFDIFRADLQKGKWYSVPYAIKDALDPKMLPELLDFINPIVDGKAIYLEYDEE